MACCATGQEYTRIYENKMYPEPALYFAERTNGILLNGSCMDSVVVRICLFISASQMFSAKILRANEVASLQPYVHVFHGEK